MRTASLATKSAAETLALCVREATALIVARNRGSQPQQEREHKGARAKCNPCIGRTGHDVQTGQDQNGEHTHALDPPACGRSFAPELSEPNQERRDYHSPDYVRQEPSAPDLPKRSRAM